MIFCVFLVCCDESEPRCLLPPKTTRREMTTQACTDQGEPRDAGAPYFLRRKRQGGKVPHRAGRKKRSRLYLLFRFPVAIGGIKTPSTHGSISLLVVDRRREYGGKLPHRVQGTSMKFCTAISYLNATTLKKFVTFRAFRG